MAIVYKATVRPSKEAIVTDWLDQQPWGGSGVVEVLGSYRFDDPDGEVGVEALLVDRGGIVLHIPLTYRAAQIAGSKKFLVATMQHSVLGDRWVYDAMGDPVAIDCFVRALRGEQKRAAVQLWDGDTLVEHREPIVRVHVQSGQDASGFDAEDVTVVERRPGSALPSGTWSGRPSRVRASSSLRGQAARALSRHWSAANDRTRFIPQAEPPTATLRRWKRASATGLSRTTGTIISPASCRC